VQAQGQQDFKCTVAAVISAAKLPSAQQAFLDSTYVGKEFSVERTTGRMAGALKVLSPVPLQIINTGDKSNGFKMVAIKQRRSSSENRKIIPQR
jgi:hypothetical protein